MAVTLFGSLLIVVMHSEVGGGGDCYGLMVIVIAAVCAQDAFFSMVPMYAFEIVYYYSIQMYIGKREPNTPKSTATVVASDVHK